MRNKLFTILIFSFSTIVFISCNQTSDTGKLRQEIIDSDRAMSKLSVEEGFLKALLFYADDDIIKLNDRQYPVIGKEEFIEKIGDNAGPKTLTWEPINADVANSGEFGYTWGNWKFVRSDTTYYGNYFTVWKKQKNGKWKVVLDGGNTTPPPKDLKQSYGIDIK